MMEGVIRGGRESNVLASWSRAAVVIGFTIGELLAAGPLTAGPARQSPAKRHPAPTVSKQVMAATPATTPVINPAVLDVIEARRFRCESTMPEVRWLGPCKNGYRDGQGTNIYEFKGTYSSTHMETLESYGEGVMAGFRCTTVDLSAFDGKVSAGPSLVGGCGLVIPYVGATWSPMVRRSAHGEWHVDDSRDDFPRPDPAPIVVDGAALEQANASLIRAAREGRPAGRIELPVQSALLADLIPEGRSTLVIDPTDYPDVSGKRVAVVLSSQALKEIDRWKAARDEFARTKGYGVLATPADAGLLAQVLDKGDPSKLLASLVSTLRTVAGSVMPAEDLSPLTRGEADYAVLADWRFDGGYFDPKQFANRPRGNTDASRVTVAQQFKFLLFDPGLRVRVVMVNSNNDSNIIYDAARDNAAWMPGTTNWNPVAAQGVSVGYFFRGNLVTLMSPEHQRQLGDNFLEGRGVPKDESLAYSTYSSAAANGDVPSMLKLAKHYDVMSHSDADFRKFALEWYTRAAKFGNWDAAATLSVIYMTGALGLAKDNQKVIEFGRLAYANERNAVTANNLGYYYQHGLGVAADLQQAAKYYREALGLGSTDAQKELDAIAPQLAALEASDMFAAELAKVKSAAQLFVLADEQAGKGDRDKARLAFRAILARFPNSPLAATAAQRLGALGGN